MIRLARDYIKIFFISFFIFSCQKEITFDTIPSSGNIMKDASGNCLPVNIGGDYVAGEKLTDAHFVEISVQVEEPGNFYISTGETNGYSFESSGTFTDKGTKVIKLSSTGTPIIAGTDQFTITYNQSTCIFYVNISNMQPDAVYNLEGAPNSCLVDTVYGSYVRGIPFDSSAQIRIGIDVTSPGKYKLATNTVNGFNFSASGIFTSTGKQTITLYATGTPLVNETDMFILQNNASECSFPINVLDVITISNNDYFPLTPGSYWSYRDPSDSQDTMRRSIIDSGTINGNSYFVMEQLNRFGGPDTYLFRKSGDTYFEYCPVDNFTGSLSFIPGVNGDIYFLNQVLYKGTTWTTDEFTGSIQGGQTILLQYVFTCLDNNATITINGNAFAHVYIISMTPQIRAVGYGYNDTGEQYIYFYAKGIGIVYMNKTERGVTQWEWQLADWKVN